jgi:hypothetical protein
VRSRKLARMKTASEIFIGSCASKFDDKTGALKDDITREFIRQQLEAFAKFIERHGGRA